MKKFFQRLNLRYLIADGFAEHKWCFLSLAIAAGVGIIIGIGLAANGSVTFINVSVTKYYSISSGISVAGVFLRRTFTTLICFGLLLAFSLHAFLCPAHFLLVMLRGYYFGALMVLLIFEYSFSGVICLIFALIPSQLIHLLCLVVAGTHGVSCSFKFRRYGYFADFKPFCFFFLFCYLVNLVGALLECLLIALIVNPLFV